MAKTKISEYSSTANSNTDIASINIDEGCAPSGINNAIRALMAQLKDFQTGAASDPLTVGGVLTVTGGSASAPAITTSGDTNTGVLFPAADTVGITTGGTERVRVDSSGNLGLGVTPNAYTVGKAIEVGGAGNALWGVSSGNPYLTANTYFDGNYRYGSTGPASYYVQNSGAHIWATAASGTAGNVATFTSAMTLDASGNLGVGTTSPTHKFTLEATSSAIAQIKNTNGSSYAQLNLVGGGITTDIGADNTGGYIEVSGANPLKFYINATERARIDSSGNLLVGTTSIFNLSKFTFDAGSSRGVGIKSAATSAHVLQVNNDSSSYADLGGGMLYIAQGGATETGFRAIAVYTNSGARFAVRGDGTIYSTNTSVQSISDERFKENIKTLDIGLAEIMQLQPRRFDWKEGKGTGEKNVAGFIAQEIETVLPELVSEFQDGIEDTTMYKSVGYSGLVPTLVKAIQEQQAIINAQQAVLETLTSRIEALEQA